jgi:hypothetical protein
VDGRDKPGLDAVGTVGAPDRHRRAGLVYSNPHCLATSKRALIVGLAHFFWIGREGTVPRAKLERRPDALDAFTRGFLATARPQGHEEGDGE